MPIMSRLLNRKQARNVVRGLYDPDTELQACEECGSTSDLVVVMKKVVCSACGLTIIHEMQDWERGRENGR